MRAILTWHSLDRSGSPISVTPEEFRRQVAWLVETGVRVVSVEEILALRPGERAAALTFDDGFANFASEAHPVLREFGLPATLFVVPGHVGRDNSWGARQQPGIPLLPLLDWDALARLSEAGVTVGSHTRTHPRLSRIQPGLQAEEIAGAAEDIARRLGARPPGFAYPYGDFDPEIVKQVGEQYRWACTTMLRALEASDPPHQLPRLDAYYLGAPARRAGWGSPLFQTWIWCRRLGRRTREWLAPAGAQ